MRATAEDRRTNLSLERHDMHFEASESQGLRSSYSELNVPNMRSHTLVITPKLHGVLPKWWSA
jgi:hypothetical protein